MLKQKQQYLEYNVVAFSSQWAQRKITEKNKIIGKRKIRRTELLKNYTPKTNVGKMEKHRRRRRIFVVLLLDY